MRTAVSAEVTRRTSSLRSGSPGTMAKRPFPSSIRAPASVSKRNFVLPLGRVRTVAGKALVGKDRADVAIEFDLLAGEHSGSEQGEYADRGRRSPVCHSVSPHSE